MPTAAKVAALQSHNVSVDYKNFRALEGLNVTVNPGEIIGVIGPNGAGKTTFIKALCGHINLSGGHFTIADKRLKNGQNRQQLIGLVPQDIGLYPHMTARENLTVFAQMMGIKGLKTRKEIVSAALHDVDLMDKQDTLVSALSGGMKRRINVAAAIMHNPKILILDEPTAGVDIPARDSLHRLARSIATSGKAVLLITHELEQAEAICDKLLILAGGQTLAFDTPANIMAQNFSTSREVVVRFSSPPDAPTIHALKPFNFSQGDTATEWSTLTNASEVSFVSAFMASLRGGNDIVREISVRRPGLTHLLHSVERTGRLPKQPSSESRND
ncbi:ABC transporter ATP-binding protein [Fretibacter rubidus]|uniref:ABC transporter ATP-binding protein n=1 Tax=Fretibacter rubidus TaxID=570162 RepID=UPI00352AC5A7